MHFLIKIDEQSSAHVSTPFYMTRGSIIMAAVADSEREAKRQALYWLEERAKDCSCSFDKEVSPDDTIGVIHAPNIQRREYLVTAQDISAEEYDKLFALGIDCLF